MEENNSSSRMINSDSAAQSYPFGFTRNGYYNWNSGDLTNRNHEGLWWQSKASSSTAISLDFVPTYLYPQGANAKGYGFSIRCLVR